MQPAIVDGARPAGKYNPGMTPDPITGRRVFIDGIVRRDFLDDAGHQSVIALDGHTRCYGTWLRPDGEADEPLVVPGRGEATCPRCGVPIVAISRAPSLVSLLYASPTTGNRNEVPS
jgi:hypothetical protein